MVKISSVWSKDRIKLYKASGYKLIVCPVCGNETFDEYTICPHCAWEYDGITKGYSDCNKSYLSVYRLKYKLRKIWKALHW